MKKAFTLFELIFAIVLMGVLSGVAFYMNRPDPTKADAQYALLKLKEARYRAIGYQSPTTSGVDGGCVILTKDALSNNTQPTYTIKSTLSLTSTKTNLNPTSHTLNGNEICYDSLGRPHDGNSVALNTLLLGDLNITFTSGAQSSAIRIFPKSGYSTIMCKN